MPNQKYILITVLVVCEQPFFVQTGMQIRISSENPQLNIFSCVRRN